MGFVHEVVNGVRVPKKGAVGEMYEFIKQRYKVDKLSQPEQDFWRNWDWTN